MKKPRRVTGLGVEESDQFLEVLVEVTAGAEFSAESATHVFVAGLAAPVVSRHAIAWPGLMTASPRAPQPSF